MKFLRRFFIMIVVVAVFGTSAYMFIPNVKSFVNSLINKNAPRDAQHIYFNKFGLFN